ncbi:SpoIIE family protein phosphatase [Cryomorphaceae bacterium 1068]|nr:SpoIIE family protein phosphatase [Cryomorphaceae bacterium 1068]
MIVLTGFFAIVSYYDTINGFEKAEMNRLKTIIKTQAHFIEALEIGRSIGSSEEHQQLIRSKLQDLLTSTNRLNELEQGVSLVLIRNHDGQKEIISSGDIVSIEKSNQKIHSFFESTTRERFEQDISAASTEESLLFAYPIIFEQLTGYRGYLFVEENISAKLSTARYKLMQRLGMALAMIVFLGIIGSKYLNRILRHEVHAKRKLKDYAALAEERNKELERLSFVMGKSETLILLTDQNGKIEWLNQKAKKTNNYSVEELNDFIGRELAEVSRYPQIKDAIEIVNRTKKKHIYETKSYDENKRAFWASTTITPILNEYGEVDNLLFVDADITKLKRAEKEISKLANFARENTNALMRFSKTGEVLFANDPGKELLSQWGSRVDGLLKKPSILNTIRLASDLEQEQKLNLESNHRIYSLRFHPVCGKDYVNVYAEDITEVKLAEKAYRDRASMIEKHNLNITDSINYAKRIQDAIIPGEDHIRKYFTDSFLIYRPKDIVSGDFVWLHEIKPQEEYLLALADCTGHGVPGAMMSIIGHSLLNEIVEGEEITDPALILEELNKEVIKTLRQKTDGESSDGMDVSIVKINIPELTITFAGAYQDIYWMNGKLNTVKGDRQPIGGKHHIIDRKFQNQQFKITKGDSIFLASDGFADQFGGPEDKKFLKKRLSELISSNYKYSMQAQSFIYEKAFENWKGAHEQIDDVSVVGIKF